MNLNPNFWILRFRPVIKMHCGKTRSNMCGRALVLVLVMASGAAACTAGQWYVSGGTSCTNCAVNTWCSTTTGCVSTTGCSACPPGYGTNGQTGQSSCVGTTTLVSTFAPPTATTTTGAPGSNNNTNTSASSNAGFVALVAGTVGSVGGVAVIGAISVWLYSHYAVAQPIISAPNNAPPTSIGPQPQPIGEHPIPGEPTGELPIPKMPV